MPYESRVACNAMDSSSPGTCGPIRLNRSLPGKTTLGRHAIIHRRRVSMAFHPLNCIAARRVGGHRCPECLRGPGHTKATLLGGFRDGSLTSGEADSCFPLVPLPIFPVRPHTPPDEPANHCQHDEQSKPHGVLLPPAARLAPRHRDHTVAIRVACDSTEGFGSR